MELNNLKIAEGSRHLPKRVGQGIGSGMGKTSTRGQKGQGARQGRKVPVGFEGGQLPLYRRIPKHGFVNYGRIEYVTLNLADLAEFFDDGDTINDIVLAENGILRNVNKPVKILGCEKIEKKLNITVQAYTKSAKAAIEAAGGTANVETLKDVHLAVKKLQASEQGESEVEGE